MRVYHATFFHTHAFVEIVKQIGVDDWFKRTHLSTNDFIWPLFVHDGEEDIPIPSLLVSFDGVFPAFVQQAQRAESLGIPAIALFPATPAEKKTPNGEEAYNPSNLVCRAMTAIRECTSKHWYYCRCCTGPLHHTWSRWFASRWCCCQR